MSIMTNRMNISSLASNYIGSSLSKFNEIEALFTKIMSPIKKNADPNLVAQFCQLINNDLDGAQQAIDLIVPKIQSSQEWEALAALYTLEACVKNCGDRFHSLIGRFRFLNEMIKLVSPKYLANKTTDKVKKKCIELIYCWSRGLPHETKITEAYLMLKRQGIVAEDPTYVDDLVITVPPRQKNPVFEDNDKSKELARLLKSKNPQDLEQANRLIKSMVKQEEIKCEKISTRINELIHVNNNIKLLNDMLLHYDRKNVTQSEKDTIKYLYDELEKMRPNLARLATETEDNDSAIGEIIQAIEQSEKIINQYKRIVDSNGDSAGNRDTNLVNIDFDDHHQKQASASLTGDDSFLLNSSMQSLGSQSGKSNQNSLDVVKDPLKELEDLFLPDPKTKAATNDSSLLLNELIGNAPLPQAAAANNPNLINMNLMNTMNLNFKPANQFTPLSAVPSQMAKPATQQAPQLFQQPPPTNTKVQNPKMKALNDLDELGRNMLEMNLNQTANTPTGSMSAAQFSNAFADASSLNGLMNASPKLSLNDIQQMKLDKQLKESIINKLQSIEQLSGPQQPPVPVPTTTSSQSNESAVFNSLNELVVKLESIKPDLKIAPMNIYDANSVKIVLHFAREPAIPGIHVVVISVTSTNTEHELKNFSFQAAVTKTMKVKLQPASRNDLPAYNPIFPPTAITQIMLVANPNQEQIKMKYKVAYHLDDQPVNEKEEIKSLPALTPS